MKKRILLFLLVLASLLFVFSACKKSTPGSIAPGLRAVVNGKSITFTYFGLDSAILIHDTALSIEGVHYTSDLDASAIGIQADFPHTGDIPISAWDSAQATALYEVTDSPAVRYALYGNLHITSITSNNVTGTFYFTCQDSTKVTNGEFNVPLHRY
jgi:hypothetical protein